MHVKATEKSEFALDNVLAVYGIRKNPFPIDEIDDYFFSTPGLGKQLDALRNLVDYGDLVLVISGVEGAGKTTLLNQSLLAANARWKCCRIDARPSMTVDSLIDELLTGYGVKVRGDDTMADEALLRAHLAQAHTSGDIAVLAVDDAHLLPQICTEFLLGLAEQRDEMELRLLLASEPGRLGFSTNDPKRVHVVVLKPFDLQQCGDYLHSRLSYAGLVGDSPFEAPVVEEIHQDSGGIPGEIHPPAVHTLLANSDTSRLRRRTPVTRRAPAYLVLVLVVAGAAAFMLRSEPGFEGIVVEEPGTTGRVKGHIVDRTTKRAIAAEEPAGTRVEDTRQPQPEPYVASLIAKKPANEGESTRQVVAKSDDGVKVFTLGGDGVSTTAAVAVTSPAPAKSAGPASSSAPAVKLAKAVTPKAAARDESPAAHDLDWLRRQNPDHYVIQLVGTRDASAARRFLDDHKLGNRGAWFTTSHEDKPWHVVVYGMYPDTASARAAIEALPEALRAGSPWPRSVASVVKNAR